ncbi:MAG TPA: hypothetical protein VK718_06155 [Ferruginibacter sp.]|jgi:hypothetical protein|nr:hypothetical protein [Ferruginibacter sp.]
MAKRNYNEEIKKLQERGEFNGSIFYYQRFHDLKSIISFTKEQEGRDFDELYRYIPIASVACIESFYRATIKSLIDKGGIYFDNLEKLIAKTDLKFDFEILSNLQKQQFTLGELVSHILPCNNLNDLKNNISILIGEDFLTAISNHRPVFFGESYDEDFLKFKNNYDPIIRSIIKTFELRHIFCHESARRISINRQEILDDFENVELFLNNSSNFINLLIDANWGLTTHDKVDLLVKELKIKEDSVNEKIKSIREERSSDINNDIYIEQLEDRERLVREFQERFDNTTLLWKEFIDAKAYLKSRYSKSYVWSQYIYLEDKIKSVDSFFEEIY